MVADAYRKLLRIKAPNLLSPHRRLSQNGAQEKLTKLWVDRCLHHLDERLVIAAE